MTRYGGENNRRERLIKVRDMERKKTKKETNKKRQNSVYFSYKML